MCEVSNTQRLKSPNRTTTYNSLLAAAQMIVTDDREQFIRLYAIATHDDAGQSCWTLMEKKGK